MTKTLSAIRVLHVIAELKQQGFNMHHDSVLLFQNSNQVIYNGVLHIHSSRVAYLMYGPFYSAIYQTIQLEIALETNRYYDRFNISFIAINLQCDINPCVCTIVSAKISLISRR